MKVTRRVMAFLGSATLAVWLVGSFILYYLTMAVWSTEAFSKYVAQLSKSNFLRAAYVLFMVNTALLTFRSLGRSGWLSARTLLRVPLAAGWIILLASFFLSVNVREFRWIMIGKGDIINLSWERERYRVAHIEPALRKKILRGPTSAIFDAEPGIVLEDRYGGRYVIGAFPPRTVGASKMHVLNYGIGPGVEVLDRGKTVYRGYVGLRLIPFGSEDTFKIDPYPYTFKLSILPSTVIKRRSETADSYDLERPVYRVTVSIGDQEVACGETGDGLFFNDGMTIRFHPPDDWVVLEAAYDPFMQWLALGIGLCVLGGILYPFSCLLQKAKQTAEDQAAPVQ